MKGPRFAALVLLAAAACIGPPGPAPPPRGGEVTVAVPIEPATLNPFARAGDTPATRDLTALLAPPLERTGPAGERVPWLLDGSAILDADPPRRLEVRIREDAAWSDGTPITAEDLRRTWEAVTDPEGSLVARDPYNRIESVEVPDPHRAIVRLREPLRRWRDLFGAGTGLLPLHALDGTDPDRGLRGGWPVSGGAFRLARWTRGLEMILERNLAAPDGGAHLDRLRVVFVPGASTALELFRRGEVDVLAGYSAPDFARRAQRAGATIDQDLGPTISVLLLSAAQPPLDDPRVRRALLRALDRERVATGLVREEGVILETLAAASDPGAAGWGAFGSRDLAAARTLLEEAGWSGAPVRTRGGEPLRVTVAIAQEDGLGRTVLRALRVQAAEAGIELTPAPMDAEHLWRDWLASPRLDAAILTWREPPGGSLAGRLLGPAPPEGQNATGIEDARLRELLDAWERAGDTGGDLPAANLDRHLAELAVVIPLYRHRVSVAARPAAVEGIRASAGADGPLWSAGEWFRPG